MILLAERTFLCVFMKDKASLVLSVVLNSKHIRDLIQHGEVLKESIIFFFLEVCYTAEQQDPPYQQATRSDKYMKVSPVLSGYFEKVP